MPGNKPEVDQRNPPQTIRGVVVSDKMNKTRIIEVKRMIRHGLYAKNMVRKTRFFVHDEKNESKLGDQVIASATRPISRHKNFKLTKIFEKRVSA